jgi:hypothetical protein
MESPLFVTRKEVISMNKRKGHKPYYPHRREAEKIERNLRLLVLARILLLLTALANHC